ncbi:MAG TPA: 2-hydroxychromene-2-carboxylate isomerase [Hyphomicrobiaceae bacterium]|jgi:2-hydroxychromene-2-carboxylate isomerase|nr:2-hydroxychromene-2-carboxylate isomerase [Hyphomicrobiaceae bacterium]
MIPTVEFLYDFGSPNAYFVHKVIPEIEQRTGAAVTYVPMLLGGVFKLTNNQPPLVAFKDVPAKRDYMRLEVARFIKKHKLTAFKWNPHFPVNTVQVMRGAIAAGEDGKAKPYIDTVFRAIWEEGRNMADGEVIRSTLDEAGLDGAHTLERIQQQDIKDKLLKSTEAAVARGVFGAPTVFVGKEMFFGKDRLREVEEEIEAANKA